MARLKNKRYLPYHKAVQYLREECKHLTTRTLYQKWHREVEPKFLPRFPERVYDEWESWSTFLGTTNSFEKTRARKKGEKIVHRTFWEAVRYAQQKAKEHNITTREQWEQWHDSGMCAKDIPKRPQLVYEEFVGTGWPVWLGTKVEAKVKTAKENVAVMCIASLVDQPPNVVTVMIEGRGLEALKENWDQTIVGRPYRVYKWEKDMVKYVDRLFNHHAFNRGDKMWLVPNMNALLFELDNILEFAIPPSQLR